jgi:hypothetical protein
MLHSEYGKAFAECNRSNGLPSVVTRRDWGAQIAAIIVYRRARIRRSPGLMWNWSIGRPSPPQSLGFLSGADRWVSMLVRDQHLDNVLFVIKVYEYDQGPPRRTLGQDVAATTLGPAPDLRAMVEVAIGMEGHPAVRGPLPEPPAPERPVHQ